MLAELTGVDAAWPLAGKLELGRAGSARAGPRSRSAARRPSGSALQLGDAAADRPGELPGVGDHRQDAARCRASRFAPPALVDEAGLAATRADPAGQPQHAPAIASLLPRRRRPARPTGKAFQQRFPDGGWRATDRDEAGGGTRRFIDRLGQMLLLVALSALAIGGLGMSSAAAAFAASRRPTIAILKLVGAPRRDDQRHAAGRDRADRRAGDPRRARGRRGGARRWSPSSPDRFLPVAPDPGPQWLALGEAALFGVLITFAASWRAIAGAGDTRPGATAARRRRRCASRCAARTSSCPALALGRRRGARHRQRQRSAASPRSASARIAGLCGLFALLGLADPAHRARRQASRRPDHPARHRRARPARRGDRAAGGVARPRPDAAGHACRRRRRASSPRSTPTIPQKAPALFLVDIPRAEEPRFAALADAELPGAELRLVPSLRGPVTARQRRPGRPK